MFLLTSIHSTPSKVIQISTSLFAFPNPFLDDPYNVNLASGKKIILHTAIQQFFTIFWRRVSIHLSPLPHSSGESNSIKFQLQHNELISVCTRKSYIYLIESRRYNDGNRTIKHFSHCIECLANRYVVQCTNYLKSCITTIQFLKPIIITHPERHCVYMQSAPPTDNFYPDYHLYSSAFVLKTQTIKCSK